MRNLRRSTRNRFPRGSSASLAGRLIITINTRQLGLRNATDLTFDWGR